MLGNYNDKEQKNIMATLTVVQTNGWSAKNTDQYQFYMILGSKIRSQGEKIEHLEQTVEDLVYEKKQLLKDLDDLSKQLGQARNENDDMEDDLTLTDTGGKFPWPAQGVAETTHRA